MISARLAGTLLASLSITSCSLLPSGGGSASRDPVASATGGAATRPVCAPGGTDLERAFAAAGCLAGDVVLAAPPGVRQAAILAARVCDFGRAVVVERRDEAGDAGAVLACTYAGRVRPVPE